MVLYQIHLDTTVIVHFWQRYHTKLVGELLQFTDRASWITQR